MDKATCITCGNDTFSEQGICDECGKAMDQHSPKRVAARACKAHSEAEPISVRRFVVHLTMGKSVTIYAQDRREAETLAMDTIVDADYASVIGIEEEELPS